MVNSSSRIVSVRLVVTNNASKVFNVHFTMLPSANGGELKTAVFLAENSFPKTRLCQTERRARIAFIKTDSKRSV